MLQIPTKQADRLNAMPDSLDYIILNNPSEVGSELLKDMDDVRKKGTKLGYTLLFFV